MRYPTIDHRDIRQKAFALLVIYVLAIPVVFQAQQLPARVVTRQGRVVNALEAEGGRLYSLLSSSGGDTAALGLGYPVPRGDSVSKTSSSGSLSAVRDAGLLKGYSIPPDRVTFAPDGHPVVVPQSPPVDGPRQPFVVEHGNRSRKRIALTIDDGYNMKAVMDVLMGLRAPATFFLTGDWCRNNPETVRTAVARGFEIANHSVTHPLFTRISDERIVREVKDTEQAIREAGGAKPVAFFRPPYGDIDSRVVGLVGQLGYTTVIWNVDTRDWSPDTSPGQLRDRATAGAGNGDIVLLHTHGPHTPAMLPEIVTNLRAMGFEVTTLSGVLQP